MLKHPICAQSSFSSKSIKSMFSWKSTTISKSTYVYRLDFSTDYFWKERAENKKGQLLLNKVLAEFCAQIISFFDTEYSRGDYIFVLFIQWSVSYMKSTQSKNISRKQWYVHTCMDWLSTDFLTYGRYFRKTNNSNKCPLITSCYTNRNKLIMQFIFSCFKHRDIS